MTTSTHLETIAANLERLRGRIAQAAARAGRSPQEVRIIGATKGVPAAAILEAFRLGITDFGENYVQEAREKIRLLTTQGVRPTWHMIGRLQANKVKTALELFDIIQSVDSLRLAEAISRRAQRRVPLLLEVNLGGEASKGGLPPEEVPEVAKGIARLPQVELVGLMTVAPIAEDPEAVRPLFQRLSQLRDEVGLKELSMGMTDDFEVAVEEGATIVRIGRALFGERR